MSFYASALLFGEMCAMKEAQTLSEKSVLTGALWLTSQKMAFFIVTAMKTSNLT
jgi:hypothetical protein